MRQNSGKCHGFVRCWAPWRNAGLRQSKDRFSRNAHRSRKNQKGIASRWNTDLPLAGTAAKSRKGSKFGFLCRGYVDKNALFLPGGCGLSGYGTLYGWDVFQTGRLRFFACAPGATECLYSSLVSRKHGIEQKSMCHSLRMPGKGGVAERNLLSDRPYRRRKDGVFAGFRFAARGKPGAEPRDLCNSLYLHH